MNEKLYERAAEAQKDFIYDKYEAGDYIIYHCHKPGTNSYSFEIILGKMGIYVGGDIDAIVYRVARGIEFLAGGDVDYYQHSKLEHAYYDKVQLDVDLLKGYLADTLWEALEEIRDWEDRPEEQPDTLEKIVKIYESREFLCRDKWEVVGELKQHNKAWDLYNELKDCRDLPEIYQIIRDSSYYNGEMPTLTKPDEGVMFCMYMVHYAAKKILEQEKN